MNARWTAPQSSGIAAEVASRAKQTAWYEVRRQVHSALYSALGGSALGRIAATVVDSAFVGTAVSSPGSPVVRAARDPAVIAAFRSVAAEFVWVGGRWVHKSAAAATDVAVQSPAPRTSAVLGLQSERRSADRVRISAAHGGISDAERSELEAILDRRRTRPAHPLRPIPPSSARPIHSSVAEFDLSDQSLQNRPPLSRAELGGGVARPVRITLLALGWMIAAVRRSVRLRRGSASGWDRHGLALAPAGPDPGPGSGSGVDARSVVRAGLFVGWARHPPPGPGDRGRRADRDDPRRGRDRRSTIPETKGRLTRRSRPGLLSGPICSPSETVPGAPELHQTPPHR